MSETSPWWGAVLDTLQKCQWNETINRQSGGFIWSLTLSMMIIGEESLNWMGRHYTRVGETKCKRVLVYNPGRVSFLVARMPNLVLGPPKGKRKNHDFSASQFLLLHNCTRAHRGIDPFLAVPDISLYREHLNSFNPDLGQVPDGFS